MSESQNREIAIFFGSQTGNAEDLANQTSKLSANFNLKAKVFDMDGFDPSQFANHKRILIITSTWGEGEMPDNAEDLWVATNETNPPLAGVNFSVCAIGDTSYVDFCQAGLDWDQKFAELGANRVHDIQLCDVDHEPEWKKWVDAVLPLMSELDVGSVSSTDSEQQEVEQSDEVSEPQENDVSEAASIPEEILQGDRELLVLFGTQSGNSEDLAALTAKMASSVHLNGVAKDMAESSMSEVASAKRILIICSTWGEGEMPDSAQALWDAANAADAPSLENVSFTICALGDTGYELYCQAGKDWDRRFEELGATRVAEMAECNVDYEPYWKAWLPGALGALASVDSSGNLLPECVELFAEMLRPKKKTAGVVASSGLEQPTLEVKLRMFRYDPVLSEQGYDTYNVSVPGHHSLQQVLVMIKETQDGSLTFRTGASAGSDPLTGMSVNGNLVLADSVRMVDLLNSAGEEGILNIEPLPGNQVIKDLLVSTAAFESAKKKAAVWIRTRDRPGAMTSQGQAIGTMSTTEARKLHSMNDISSEHLLHSMSETLPFNSSYLGPAVCHRLWLRSNDSRISKLCREEMREKLQGSDGIWAETDIGVFGRYGRVGGIAAKNLNDCRSELLRAHRFAGKSGRYVKWFCKTVKSSGNFNETIVTAQTQGPLGAIANLPTTLRMALGFTRNGGPPVRDWQGFIAPGKMPPLLNKSIDRHHELVAIFNELDKRF